MVSHEFPLLYPFITEPLVEQDGRVGQHCSVIVKRNTLWMVKSTERLARGSPAAVCLFEGSFPEREAPMQFVGHSKYLLEEWSAKSRTLYQMSDRVVARTCEACEGYRNTGLK
jgi:hypothetical protein